MPARRERSTRKPQGTRAVAPPRFGYDSFVAKSGLLVIGAGMGRTGTSSLKRALEQLGLGPCHHMEEVVKNPAEVPTWEAAARGEQVDWVTFTKRWRSAVDFPSALYWRELMTAFPEGKVILSVRDPAGWYESMRQTIVPIMTRFPITLVVPLLPYVSGPLRVMRSTQINRELFQRFDRERAERTFVEWNEEVKRTVPKERLLVFEAKQGWAPLCEFLGVPVPEGPYPRVNDTAEFRRRNTIALVVSWFVLLAPLVLVILLARWLF